MLITSLNNQNVVAWAKLKQTKHQKQQQQFIIEERLLIDEAIKAKLKCTIIVREGVDLKADYVVSDQIMKKISQNDSLNDIVAVCDFYDVEPEKQNKIVYLDNVQDPGNVGTIIRTAYAFGYDQVVLSNNTVNKYNHKLIGASKGAMFHMSIVDELDLLQYKNKDYEILVTALDKTAEKIENVETNNNMIIIFGNEGSGVSRDVLNIASKTIYVDMLQFDSLNVAATAAIVLYHLK